MALLQNKFVVLILGSLVMAAAGWYIFLRVPVETPLLQTDTLSASGADRDVVETLLALRSITLSGTIFSDPAFINLTDTGTQIVPEPVGRPNPFLPLEGMKPVTPAGTKTATTSAPAPQKRTQ